jgi:heavy metal sensor kinase
MMARLSTRTRLTFWYAAVLLLGLTLFGSGLWFAVKQRLLAGVDDRLAQRVRGVQTVLEIEGADADRAQMAIELSEFAREVPDGTLMQLRDGEGYYILPLTGRPASSTFQLPAGAAREARYRTVAEAGRQFRVLTTRVVDRGQQYDLLVAGPLDDVLAVTRDLRNLLLTAIPGVLLVACLGGYWLSRRALGPVDGITRDAKSISVQNLSKRLAVPQTGDELQRLSETWNDMLERLEAAVKRITQFTADASHELRTPIALIRTTADLALRRERDTTEYRKALCEIALEAERMGRLTEDLLALARADSTAVEIPLAPVDVNDVVAEVIERSRALAETRGVQVVADLSSGVGAASANQAALRRLLLILIDNALKHTPAGGTVSVATRKGASGISLSVMDSGEGIGPEAIPHIFDRFYRADSARSRNGGTGLGLSIAQAIAYAHGTKIEVVSEPGAGACFRLLLPE